MYFMKNTEVHLLSIYCSDLKTCVYFFFFTLRKKKILPVMKNHKRKIYESWLREEDVEIIV